MLAPAANRATDELRNCVANVPLDAILAPSFCAAPPLPRSYLQIGSALLSAGKIFNGLASETTQEMAPLMACNSSCQRVVSASEIPMQPSVASGTPPSG